MHRHAFLFNSLLVCLLAAPAWGQTYNPTVSDPTTQNTPEGMGALPTCQVQLAACKNTLMSTQRKLARCTTNFNTCTNDLGDCQTDLDACETEPNVIFPGDGYPNTPGEQVLGIDHGPALSYTDNGDGTFIDNSTKLIWEKKTGVYDGYNFSDPHHVSNEYSWSKSGTVADGTLFTDFLPRLNTPPCFAGHCNWRIPNIRELQSLVDYSTSGPAGSVPGPTAGGPLYWSSTPSYASGPAYVWGVYFTSSVVLNVKTDLNPVRAVRSGQ